jgi:ribosomal protein L11 methyltransferase
MTSEWLEERVVFELTEEQRSQMLEDTGISMATITATRAAFIGMAIVAEARAGAGGCRPGARVKLDLTENQRRRLSQELRTPVASLLLRLEGDVGYYENWTKDFPAFYLGDRLWVTRHGGGEEPSRPAAVVRLLADDQDEGVFGTGRHPATEIAARLLEEWIPPGGYVADIGAGSGILTIAALRLGAARVLAVDVDEASVGRTLQNVAINDVSDRVVVAHREIDPAVDGPFDLVIANLLPDLLLGMARTFAGVVRPSGTLLISGVVRRRLDEVAAAIEAHGFRSLQERSNGMWAGRALRRL